MAKTRGEARADRLRQMEELYVLRAYSDVEMAERLRVRRETVYDDRQLLMAKFDFEDPSEGRYKIKRTGYISNIGLNLFQSLPLYLFARKSARQLGIAQPHVAEAMEKLAHCVKKPMAEHLARSATRVLQQEKQIERVRVFEQIAEAWAENRKVHLDYIALNSTRERRHTLSPYLIEPSVWSDAIYIIGWSEPDRKVMPFKLDRIVWASVSGETFNVPEDFDEDALLRHAWGVWSSAQAPTTVRLRFTNPIAIRRLKETKWHPLQEDHKDLPDGSCEWSAPIAEWQEMLPWLRGWGGDCEVLEPTELRETMMGEVKVMAERYGWHVISQANNTSSSTLDDFFGGQGQ
jgi:CRISPR-associated endonuclease/helicase Cas3